MNKLKLVFLWSLISCHVFAQSEFETFENGLIYSPTTMKKLGVIVDSLNLKYKVCDLDKVYYSKQQTKGHVIKLEKGQLKEAKIDLENNIKFEDFVKKYPKAVIKKNVLIVKFKHTSYKGDKTIDFSEISLNRNYGFNLVIDYDEDLDKKEFKEKWIFEHNGKTKYSNESIQAFYFLNNFESRALTDMYSRKIGYTDCLIDTTITKFKEETKSGWVDLPKDYEKLSLAKKQKLLDEMRSTRVMGMCSMDNRPRMHAVNIALLSAETTNWEVFLRSHLDIMNDRFDRMSDGSYAWAQRKTYIKELEELDINVVDLLIGISLRVENPANNHYYGSIGRVGRAISESKDKKEFLNQIRLMIEDPKLDDYNRVLSYFLCISIINYIENEKEVNENIELLKRSIEKLPDHLKSKIDFEE